MKNQKGFTLLEIIIAMGLFVVIAAAAYSMAFGGFRTFSTNVESVDDQQSVRSVFMLISKDMRRSLVAPVVSELSLVLDDVTYTYYSGTGKVWRNGIEIAEDITDFTAVYDSATQKLTVTVTGFNDGKQYSTTIYYRN